LAPVGAGEGVEGGDFGELLGGESGGLGFEEVRGFGGGGSVAWGVEGEDFGELLRGESGELGFEEVGGFSGGGNVAWGEHRPFIGDVAEDGGHPDVRSVCEGGDGEIAEEVAVEGGVVHEERASGGTGEGSVEVLGLESRRVEGAEAGEGGIRCLVAAGALNEPIVHKLRFGDIENRSKRLGFRGCGVEEAVIAAPIGGHEESDCCSTGTVSSNDDVVRVTAELNSVNYCLIW